MKMTQMKTLNTVTTTLRTRTVTSKTMAITRIHLTMGIIMGMPTDIMDIKRTATTRTMGTTTMVIRMVGEYSTTETTSIIPSIQIILKRLIVYS